MTAMQPLSDVRVLAVTVYLAGPFLGMTLARFGAEVIKVEVPGSGDTMREAGPFAGPEGLHPERRSEADLATKFMKRTQGAKSITLNLKDPEGRRLFLALAEQADVIIENLAPGSMRRLGLDYENVRKVNPAIIYCSISGYGQDGPYASNPAHDHQIQAMSGMMDINGQPDGPPTRVGVFVSDLVTPLYCAYSIMGALRQRDRSGEGQYLDASMMDTLATLMFMEPLEDAIEEGLPRRAGNDARNGPTGLYSARDGDLIITVTNDERFYKLCTGLDAPDLLADPRFASVRSRAEHLQALRAELRARFARLSVAEAVERLEAADVPVAPVRTLEQSLGDRHYYDRGTLVPMRHPDHGGPLGNKVVVGFPVRISGEALPTLAAAPGLGAHNEEIYAGLLGLDEQ
ncbi:MAG: CoA transferase, partial [Gammaproteobacteria bacterium]|nr:CoA transferase [Gammaproteobacteria bacterium]